MTMPSTGRSRRRALSVLASPLLVVLAAEAAAAQLPPPTSPARADTASLGFSAMAGAPAPVALHVLADTVTFGGILDVAWDLPAGAAAGPAGLPKPVDDRLAAAEPGRRRWWRPGGGGQDAGVADKEALAALPPATGERVVARYRVYRADPFRLEWAGRTTPVVHVRGRVEDPGRLAAIRDPRALPWLTPALVVLVLAGLLGIAAGWWWWRRRRRGEAPGDWPLPEPAWLAAALALRDLLAERRLERGEARAFLDGLAAVARQFAGAHYGVPAPDLTGAELRSACAARGHEPGGPGALASLIEDADLRRYDPQPPGTDWCRQQSGRLLGCIADSRVEPRFTPVTAERKLAAVQAWAELTRGTPTTGVGQAATGGEW